MDTRKYFLGLLTGLRQQRRNGKKQVSFQSKSRLLVRVPNMTPVQYSHKCSEMNLNNEAKILSEGTEVFKMQ